MAGQFVTLGPTSKRGYSTDGINWTVDGPLTNLDSSPTGADYNPTADLLVAGGSVTVAGKPSRSSGSLFDTWTIASSSGMSLAVRMVTYSPDLDLWIAGTENSEVGSSPDGDVWTLESSTFNGFVRAGAWSPSLSLFVAAGASTAANSIRTSPDGSTWTSRTNPGISSNHAVWSPSLGLFVLTGQRFSPSTNPAVATSSNGTTWTLRTVPGTLTAGGEGWSLEWSETLGLFVVGTLAGELITSSDGTTWTQQTSPFGSDPVNSIAWSSDLGLFVAVGGNGKLATSTDGSTWTSRTSGFGTGSINEVLWVESVASLWTVGSTRWRSN